MANRHFIVSDIYGIIATIAVDNEPDELIEKVCEEHYGTKCTVVDKVNKDRQLVELESTGAKPLIILKEVKHFQEEEFRYMLYGYDIAAIYETHGMKEVMEAIEARIEFSVGKYDINDSACLDAALDDADGRGGFAVLSKEEYDQIIAHVSQG